MGIKEVWDNTSVQMSAVFIIVLLLTFFYREYVTDILYGGMVGGIIFAIIAMVFWFGIRPMIR